VVAVLLAIAAGAQAAPAVVKVFEGTARARPDAAAPVLHVFPEGYAVSVSEDVVDGWRRVRMPDGGVGFIRDDEVALKAASVEGAPAEQRPAEPAAPVTPLAAPQPLRLRPTADGEAADLLPAPSGQAPAAVRKRGGPIYIKDLDHLASLVAGDQVVGPMAQHLVDRKFQSSVVGLTGLVVGGALALGGFALRTQNCAAAPGSVGVDAPCIAEPRTGLMLGGIGVMGVSVVAALLLRPWRGDILDVVNTWNERHPDEPFTVQGTAAPRSGFSSW
jgi:hypothetical protein